MGRKGRGRKGREDRGGEGEGGEGKGREGRVPQYFIAPPVRFLEICLALQKTCKKLGVVAEIFLLKALEGVLHH